MDKRLTGLYDQLNETLYVDLKKAKKLNAEQVQRFRDYFQIDMEDPGLFYNAMNLIIADLPTFEELQNFIRVSDVVTRVESKEHNLFFVVYPYFNDILIKQALGQKV